MSELFTKANMQAGEVYRLHEFSVCLLAASYIVKLFVAGSNKRTGDKPSEITHAVCLEDGYVFDGFLDHSKFVAANAKIVDLD